MRFCVLGAGNGGRAFAAYLSSKGHMVNLWNRSYSRIADIIKKGNIKATGALKGKFPINLATQNIKHALKDVDIILVVTPAFAHKDIANLIAPHLTQEQLILLNPGRTFGAAEFRNQIKRRNNSIRFFIGETQTLLFTSRQLKKNSVNILKIKDSVDFCALPENDNFFIYDTLSVVFPQLNPIDDYLEVSLRNIGMLLHPALGLLNAGFMDIGKEFNFYKDGATPHTCEVVEQMQLEINKVFGILGLKRLDFCEWANKSYGVKENCIHKSIQKIIPYQNIPAPSKLITRYFTEDVPTGLVPISSLAEYLGIKTPTINSIIHLSSILCGIKFKEVGRNFKKLGLNELLEQKIDINHIYNEVDDEYRKMQV